MKIIDITPDHENNYFCCLEEWSEEMKEAGNQKLCWYEYMKSRGLRVKFAVDDNNEIGGMIHYLPIEHSMFEGENLYVVLCIWVHGHKEGRGNHQEKGMGTALLKAAEEDCKQLDTNGLVCWGPILPFFMRASWFKKRGYKVIDKKGVMRVMWKTFNEKAIPPKFIKRKKQVEKGINKVNITIFKNGWCPAQNLAIERAKRASKEFPDKIDIIEFDAKDKKIINEWGITDGLFIEDKEVRLGPPPSYEKLRKRIAKKVKIKG